MLLSPRRLIPFFIACATVALLLPTSMRGAVTDPDGAFSRANQDFERGDYASAEAAYRTLAQSPLASAELYYNLGNALYRLDRPGEAALWYRRALALDPRFAEARQNLQVVKKKTGYLVFETRGIDAWLSRFGRGEWVAMLSVGLWVAALSVTAVFVVRRLRDWRSLLWVAAAFGLATAGFSAWGLHRLSRSAGVSDDLAVVTAGGAMAVTSPVPDAEKVVDLPPGSELQILQTAGPWTYVAIPEDLRGWVRSEHLARVTDFPATSPEKR